MPNDTIYPGRWTVALKAEFDKLVAAAGIPPTMPWPDWVTWGETRTHWLALSKWYDGEHFEFARFPKKLFPEPPAEVPLVIRGSLTPQGVVHVLLDIDHQGNRYGSIVYVDRDYTFQDRFPDEIGTIEVAPMLPLELIDLVKQLGWLRHWDDEEQGTRGFFAAEMNEAFWGTKAEAEAALAEFISKFDTMRKALES